MKILFNTATLYQQNTKKTNPASQNPCLKKTAVNDSFISFSSKEKKKDNSLKNSIKLIMTAALISASGHAKETKELPYSQSPAISTLEGTKWWNKFNKSEQKVIEKVENEVARAYEESGKRLSAKDTPKIIENLELNKKDSSLVKSLLETYEKNHYNDFYAAGAKHISPRKQELETKALVEIFTFAFETGKVLRYSEENLEKLMNKIQTKKSEKPFIKNFLEPYLNINKDQNSTDFYNNEITGDFDEN